MMAATTATLSPASLLLRRTSSPATSNSHRLSGHSTTVASTGRTSQEFHIVTVEESVVMLEKRPAAQESYAQESYITRVMAGPLPPSPPASVTHGEDEDDERNMPTGYVPKPTAMQPPVFPTEGSSTDTEASETAYEPGFFQTPIPTPPRRPIPPPQRLQRASTETKASASSIRAMTSGPPAHLPSPPPTSFSKSAAHLSSDGYLQPPPLSLHRERPTRRNTTGSSSKPPAPPTTSVGELEEDIQLHADNIRRERLSKRAKMQQAAEAEAALTRKDSKDSHIVVVGNLIGEGHVNYVLMYNMLTGIRIGVSRCQAKIKRPLTTEDFTAKHKFSFDIIGNELTPSAKYDFKFKDYAPWVFRSLREDHFHLDPADYLLSLTSKYILSELGSPGKSGSFFYFSRDYRFIIKTIHHAEHAFLLKILPQYYAHVQANPHTLLSRFYGLHRVKLPRGRKIHFVIMNNIFPPHRDIHETYDLKGSTVGREYPEDKAQENPRAVLKDLNWINRGRSLELGPEKRALLAEQLRRDAEFLKMINVMDYSLLVGIHNMQRGNRDNVRRNTLKVFSPQLPHTPHRKMALGHSHSYSHHSAHYNAQGQGSPEAIAMRRALYRTSGPERLEDNQLPDAADPEPVPPDVGITQSAPPDISTTQVQQTQLLQGRPASSSSPSHTYQHNRIQSQASSHHAPPPHRSSHRDRDRRGSGDRDSHRGERDSHKERGKEKDLADHFTDRQHFMFYQDEGGLRATDESNEDMDAIYYVGVIDILTPYGGLKKLESFWKGLSADRHKISPVPPAEYADRFLSFMRAILRGGEGGARFKAE